MAPVYVRKQGAVVRKRGEQLRITLKGKEVKTIPLIHVDQVVLVGNVQLTTQAAAMLLRHEVDVVFLSSHYTFRGRLLHTGSKFAELRHAQLRKMSQEELSLAIAKALIVGKLTNQRTVLQRQQNAVNSPQGQQKLYQAISGIKQMIAGAQQSNNIDTLRGYEGKAGAYYFGAWQVIMPQGFEFKGRAYYPPPDPVNSVLSFGYSLLTKDVTAAVQLVGLDPYFGFFHVIHYGRPSLALDMMEEFRPIIVDGMVLDLLKRKQLTPHDFEWTGNSQRPVQLTNKSLEVVLKAYEGRLQTEVFHPVMQQNTTYRRCIELQVRQVAQIILEKKNNYHPMLIR